MDRPQNIHPQRDLLYREAHARPPFSVRAPSVVSCAVFLAETEEVKREAVRQVADLAAGADRPALEDSLNQYTVETDAYTLKIELHTEFVTYTILRPGPPPRPLKAAAIWPAGLLENAPGAMISGCHIACEVSERAPQDLASSFRFNTDRVFGSRAALGDALLMTDFQLGDDGFVPFVMASQGTDAVVHGRLIKCLLDIEAYRTLALLALPIVRENQGKLRDLEGAIAELAHEFHRSNRDAEIESRILDRLIELSSEVERLRENSRFRISASRAYFEIVETRLEELGETPVPPVQTFKQFIEHRLIPAINTIEAVARRQKALSQSIANFLALLRTRVDHTIEVQNQELLKSMNRRTRQQLHLNQTVEGLSVAAISYYISGLIAYLAKGVKYAGLDIDPEVVVAVFVPIVVFSVWATVRKARRELENV